MTPIYILHYANLDLVNVVSAGSSFITIGTWFHEFLYPLDYLSKYQKDNNKKKKKIQKKILYSIISFYEFLKTITTFMKPGAYVYNHQINAFESVVFTRGNFISVNMFALQNVSLLHENSAEI